MAAIPSRAVGGGNLLPGKAKLAEMGPARGCHGGTAAPHGLAASAAYLRLMEAEQTRRDKSIFHWLLIVQRKQLRSC